MLQFTARTTYSDCDMTQVCVLVYDSFCLFDLRAVLDVEGFTQCNTQVPIQFAYSIMLQDYCLQSLVVVWSSGAHMDYIQSSARHRNALLYICHTCIYLYTLLFSRT